MTSLTSKEFDQELRALRERLARLAKQPAVRGVAARFSLGDARLRLADVDAWLRATVTSIHHPVGTCRMGDAADPRTVVDPRCRVLGVEGLRVVDASVMPEIPRANTNLTTIMIAEAMAERIGRGEG